MSDPRHDPPAEFDREIDVRHIVEIGIWLAAMTIGAVLVAWGYYHLLARGEKQLDQKPSPIAEANRPRVPAGPQLLGHPETELAQFRALEQQRLESWGWVDESAGIAHVPIERALDEVAAAGSLPDFAPSPAPEASAP